MHKPGLIVLWTCSCALAAPRSRRSTSTIHARDSGNTVSIPGIIIAVIVGVILIAGLVLYFLNGNNFITRRGWFQRLREKKKEKRQSANKELLNNPFDDDQEALSKRASFQSERESIMFNRSRASSLQFAVVENTDESRRSISQHIYVLQDNAYVPIQKVDTVQAQQEATAIESRASQRSASISPDDDQESTYSSIPVVITPPLDDQPNRSFEDNMHSTSVDRREAAQKQSTPLTR